MKAAMCKTDSYYSIVYPWNNFCVIGNSGTLTYLKHVQIIMVITNLSRLLVQPSRNGMQRDLHLAVSDAWALKCLLSFAVRSEIAMKS